MLSFRPVFLVGLLMYLNPNWRILTVGDGDLSFSLSLFTHHRPCQLTATIFDSQSALAAKYQQEQLMRLRELGCQVLTGFDVTRPETWQGLAHQAFDVVIFQFPLLPGFESGKAFQHQCRNVSVNTLNRRLLRQYLIHCFRYFLDPDGVQLSFITSKDVKPYRAWNIENALTLATDIPYLGSMPFRMDLFPGYKIRHVDRDKHVKDTQGTTYVWGKATPEIREQLTPHGYLGQDYCAMCRVGPFTTELDRSQHLSSKRHQTMQAYEIMWIDDINRQASEE